MRFSHASGKWSRPNKAVRQHHDLLRAQGSDIITSTEAGAPKRKAVYTPIPGWGSYRGPGPDRNPISWRKARLTPVDAYEHRISDKHYWRVTGKRVTDWHATVVEFRDLAVVSVHLPVRNTRRRRRVWEDCIRGLTALVADLKAKFGDRVIVAGDWNIDLRGDGRKIAKRIGLTYASQTRTPARGTIRRSARVIDGIFTNLPVTKSWVHAPSPASDHQTISADLDIETRPGTRGNNFDAAEKALEKALKWSNGDVAREALKIIRKVPLKRR